MALCAMACYEMYNMLALPGCRCLPIRVSSCCSHFLWFVVELGWDFLSPAPGTDVWPTLPVTRVYREL